MFDQLLTKAGIINKIQEAVNSDLCFSVAGAGVGERALSIFQLSKQQKIAYVTSDQIELLEMSQCLSDLGVNYEVVNFDLTPPLFSRVVDNLQKNEQCKSLYNFCFSDTNILLLNAESLLVKFHQKLNKNNYLKLQKNSKINYEQIIKNLINLGYKKCQKIEQIGDFSIKGDILDIYLINYENPIRIDIFDDEIENIFFFSFSEMKKLDEVEQISIYPNKLCFFDEQLKQHLIASIKTSVLGLNCSGDALIKSHSLANQICELLDGNIIDSDTDFLMQFMPEQFSVFEILQDAKIVISEPKKTYDYLCDVSKSLLASVCDFIDSGELFPEHAGHYFLPEQAFGFKPNLIFSNVEQKLFKADVNDFMRTVGTRNYVYDFKALANDLFIYQQSKYKIVLFAGNADSVQTISDFLIKYNIFASDQINLLAISFK